MMVRVDAHYDLPCGSGASGAIKPRSASASQNAGGTARVASARFWSNSAIVRAPGMTRGDGRMRARKLQRRGAQRDIELGAHRFDRGDARDKIGRRRSIVEIRRAAVGRMRAGRQDAGVVRTADDERHAALLADRQQLGKRALVEQRIAAGEQHDVEIDLRQHVDADPPVVDAEAEAADHPAVAQLGERGNRAAQHLVEALRVRRPVGIAIDVVDVDDVEPRNAEALQALVDRAQRPGAGIVPALPVRQHIDIAVLLARRGTVRNEQSSDLRREDVLVSRDAAERLADADFRKAVAVMRRGIEIADAGCARVPHQCDRFVFGDGVEEIAQRRAAESERIALQPRLQPRVEHAGVLIGWCPGKIASCKYRLVAFAR